MRKSLVEIVVADHDVSDTPLSPSPALPSDLMHGGNELGTLRAILPLSLACFPHQSCPYSLGGK